jgi:phosphoenolpyruvate synthase/pyruvate phosphate dikinase
MGQASRCLFSIFVFLTASLFAVWEFFDHTPSIFFEKIGLTFFSSKKQQTTRCSKKLKLVAEKQGYGYKTANLCELEHLLGNKKIDNYSIKIPDFIGISDHDVKHFFKAKGLDIYSCWQQLQQQYFSDEKKRKFIRKTKSFPKQFFDNLEQLKRKIRNVCFCRTFDEKQKKSSIFFDQENVSKFIDNSRKNRWKLMIRSTGKEDTDKVSNAGGNHTESNVFATNSSLRAASAKVLISYFSKKSLQQRLYAGDETVFNVPLMPLLLQRMICEEEEGGGDQIPVGCVVHTQEVEGNCPGVTLIQSTFGHNEGVVSSSVSMDTFYVDEENTIYQTIQKKNYRLAPYGREEMSFLKLKKNPENIQNVPALEKNLLLAIKKISSKIQAHYGCPMDLELICWPQRNRIYIVQARPIVVGRKRGMEVIKVNASFLKKFDEYRKYSCTVAHTAGATVKKISNSSQIIVAETLDQALTTYNAGGRKNIQAIVVEQKAEPMSHAAAIFRGEGIIVVKCRQAKQLKKWLYGKGKIIFIDPQQKIIVKKSTSQENLQIEKGWIEYPLLDCISIISKRKDPCLASNLQDYFPEKSYKELIHQIQNESGGAAKNALISIIKKVENIILDIQRNKEVFLKSKNLYMAKVTEEVFSKLKSIKVHLDEVFGRIQSTLHLPKNDIRRLYHIKFLKNILLQKTSKQVVNNHSIVTVLSQYYESISFVDEVLQPLIKQKLVLEEFLQKPSFVQYAHLGARSALTKRVKNNWIIFLDQFKSESTEEEEYEFKKMVESLSSLKIFSCWLNSSFARSFRRKNLSGLASMIPFFNQLRNEYFSSKELLLKFKKQESVLKHSLATEKCDSPAIFAKQLNLFKNKVASFFLSDQFSSLLVHCNRTNNVLMKCVIQSMFLSFVTALDVMIKTMKGSTLYPSVEQKIIDFKFALKLYISLLPVVKTSHLVVKEMKNILIRTSVNDLSQLKSSSKFNVGNVLNFEDSLSENKQQAKENRQEPETIMTTLEDVFTSTHQLLLHKISKQMVRWKLGCIIEKPLSIVKAQQELELNKNLAGIRFEKNSVVYLYNEQLRFHSMNIELCYNIKKYRYDICVRFYGENEFLRWTILKDFINLISNFLSIDLRKTKISDNEFMFVWRPKKQTNLNSVGKCFYDIVDTTFSLGIENEEKIYKKLKKVLWKLFDHLLKRAESSSAVFSLLYEKLIKEKSFNFMLLPALEMLPLLDNRLKYVMEEILKNIQGIFKNNNENKLPMGFLMCDELAQKAYACNPKNKIIARYAQTNFEGLYEKASVTDKEITKKVRKKNALRITKKLLREARQVVVQLTKSKALSSFFSSNTNSRN